MDATEIGVLAVLPVGPILAAVMLARLWHLPASFYSIGIRIMVAQIFPLILCIYLAWFVVPTGHLHTIAKTCAVLFCEIMAIALVLVQLEMLKVLSPFVSGIHSGFIFAAQAVFSLAFAGIIAATLSRFLTDAGLAVYLVSLLVWHAGVGVFDTAVQLFLLYFVLYKLKAASVPFRVRYALLISINIVVMVVPGVYFLSQMSFGVRMLGFVGSTCSIYAVLAAECVNMLRMALLRLPPRHAAAGEQVLGSSTIPDSAIALRSKVPATPPVTPLSIAAQ